MMWKEEVDAVVNQMTKLVINPAPTPTDDVLKNFWNNYLLNTDTANALRNGVYSDQAVYCKVHSVYVSSRLALGLAVQKTNESILTFISNNWYEQPYKRIYIPRVSFGQDMEPAATQMYSKQKGCSVKKCKNAVNPKIPFLIASPDGLVFEKGLLSKAIEIKTITDIHTTKDIHLVRCCHKKRDELLLKRHSSTFAQMQFTMLVLNIEEMDLVLYFPNMHHIEIVNVRCDNEFLNFHLRHLYYNYVHYLMPYLITKIATIHL